MTEPSDRNLVAIADEVMALLPQTIVQIDADFRIRAVNRTGSPIFRRDPAPGDRLDEVFRGRVVGEIARLIDKVQSVGMADAEADTGAELFWVSAKKLESAPLTVLVIHDRTSQTGQGESEGIGNGRVGWPAVTIEDRARDGAERTAFEHARQYLESDGASVDHPAVGSLILLYTTGRVSGEIRRTPLRFFEVDDHLLVAASSRGSSSNPDWYLNLVDDPKVWVRRDADLYPASAVPIEGSERDRLWESTVLRTAPRFAEYQAMTERTIPLVRLVAER